MSMPAVTSDDEFDFDRYQAEEKKAEFQRDCTEYRKETSCVQRLGYRVVNIIKAPINIVKLVAQVAWAALMSLPTYLTYGQSKSLHLLAKFEWRAVQIQFLLTLQSIVGIVAPTHAYAYFATAAEDLNTRQEKTLNKCMDADRNIITEVVTRSFLALSAVKFVGDVILDLPGALGNGALFLLKREDASFTEFIMPAFFDGVCNCYEKAKAVFHKKPKYDW